MLTKEYLQKLAQYRIENPSIENITYLSLEQEHTQNTLHTYHDPKPQLSTKEHLKNSQNYQINLEIAKAQIYESVKKKKNLSPPKHKNVYFANSKL